VYICRKTNIWTAVKVSTQRGRNKQFIGTTSWPEENESLLFERREVVKVADEVKFQLHVNCVVIVDLKFFAAWVQCKLRLLGIIHVECVESFIFKFSIHPEDGSCSVCPNGKVSEFDAAYTRKAKFFICCLCCVWSIWQKIEFSPTNFSVESQSKITCKSVSFWRRADNCNTVETHENVCM
jgi:hypothetical protein